LHDFDYMTVGMILDFVITYNNEYVDDDDNSSPGQNNKVRMATQADFDSF
jgi:hypothetical protein